MSDYRPGQLRSGRDCDLLFTVLGEGGIEFVTNRGTRVPVAEAERVYAPLELVRDVTERPQVPAQDVIAAVYGALNIPEPAAGAHDSWTDLLARRAMYVTGALEELAEQPDLDNGPTIERSTVRAVRMAADRHPVTYLTREQEQAAQDTALRPPVIVCQHCTRLLAWDCGDWRHLDDDHRECDPDAWAGAFAEPVDDPAVRAFASELVGRRVGVALHSGEYLLGVLTESADWKVTVQVDGEASPKVLRFRRIQHVQPLERDGGA